jgi:hypothetical protein
MAFPKQRVAEQSDLLNSFLSWFEIFVEKQAERLLCVTLAVKVCKLDWS